MTDIKAGDVVELKSGGPAMTVLQVEDDEAIVAWFNENNSLCRDDISVDALHAVTKSVG